MKCVIFHEKCASFSLAMESVILQKARLIDGQCVRALDVP